VEEGGGKRAAMEEGAGSREKGAQGAGGRGQGAGGRGQGALNIVYPKQKQWNDVSKK
jgi:hypothetical protein